MKSDVWAVSLCVVHTHAQTDTLMALVPKSLSVALIRCGVHLDMALHIKARRFTESQNGNTNSRTWGDTPGLS